MCRETLHTVLGLNHGGSYASKQETDRKDSQHRGKKLERKRLPNGDLEYLTLQSPKRTGTAWPQHSTSAILQNGCCTLRKPMRAMCIKDGNQQLARELERICRSCHVREHALPSCVICRPHRAWATARSTISGSAGRPAHGQRPSLFYGGDSGAAGAEGYRWQRPYVTHDGYCSKHKSSKRSYWVFSNWSKSEAAKSRLGQTPFEVRRLTREEAEFYRFPAATPPSLYAQEARKRVRTVTDIALGNTWASPTCAGLGNA